MEIEKTSLCNCEKLCIFALEFKDPMTAHNNIAKSHFSNAFFSKSSDGNPWSDTYFCARYNRKTTFTFTGKERDAETGYGYFGARYMDHELMTMWLSVDPMADKYPSISPYSYCAWNPVKLVDPNAICYLAENGVDDIYNKLNSRPETIIIEELSFEDAYKTQYNPSHKKILWCPTAALLTTEDVKLSPTNSLNHEMDHCLENIEHPETQRTNYRKEVSGYRNAEEERVITGSEQRTALALGEIKQGQVTRRDHTGTIFKTESSTTNSPLDPNTKIQKPMSNSLKPFKVTPKPK